MIRDFAEFDDSAAVAADICIVGGGGAGITMARQFIGIRFSVLMPEGGGLEPSAETQKLYESEVVGLPHAGVYEGRARVFGGTTHCAPIAAGTGVPITPLDPLGS